MPPSPRLVLPPSGTVGDFVDGLGNLMRAIQWDGDPGTAETAKELTNGRATLDRRGVMGVQTDLLRNHVGLNDWICVDANRVIFVLSNQQIQSSYTNAPGNP